MQQYRQSWSGAACGAVLGLLLAGGCAGGRQVPDFKFVTVDGQERTISSFRGEPVVLNYFGKSCVPCMAELPRFQDAYTAKQGQFEMIILAGDEDGLKDYVSGQGYNMTFGVDKGGMAKLNVSAIPHTFFIDRLGRITYDQVGEISGAEFDRQLQRIL
jgi:peroxiredoxin